MMFVGIIEKIYFIDMIFIPIVCHAPQVIDKNSILLSTISAEISWMFFFKFWLSLQFLPIDEVSDE